MNCYLLVTLLDEHFDRALDAATEAGLLAHVATCADCAAVYAREQWLRRSLQALPVPAPAPGFAERVFARAKATRSERRSHVKRSTSACGPSMASCRRNVRTVITPPTAASASVARQTTSVSSRNELQIIQIRTGIATEKTAPASGPRATIVSHGASSAPASIGPRIINWYAGWLKAP